MGRRLPARSGAHGVRAAFRLGAFETLGRNGGAGGVRRTVTPIRFPSPVKDRSASVGAPATSVVGSGRSGRGVAGRAREDAEVHAIEHFPGFFLLPLLLRLGASEHGAIMIVFRGGCRVEDAILCFLHFGKQQRRRSD